MGIKEPKILGEKWIMQVGPGLKGQISHVENLVSSASFGRCRFDLPEEAEQFSTNQRGEKC